MSLALSTELVHQTFPFHLAFDRRLRITGVGRSLAKCCPRVGTGCLLSEFFFLEKPAVQLDFESLGSLDNERVLLGVRGDDLRLLGQVLRVDEDHLLFLGSPRLDDLASLKTLGLSSNDFAAHDSVADSLSRFAAKDTSLRELKELAESLKQTEEALRVAKAEAEAAQRAKSDFLAVVSHELRTPLTAILGMTALARETASPRQRADDLQRVATTSKNLLSLIDDMLATSGIEAARGRILVAEDNRDNQTLARLALERAGYTVDIAEDGREASRLAASDRYDLILMDLEMPGASGFQSTTEIRSREKTQGLEPVPIVALTAHAVEGYRERCLAAGMNEFVAKPIAGDRLVDLVRRWIPDLPVVGVPPDRILEGRESRLPADFPGDSIAIDPDIADLIPEFLDNRLADVCRLEALSEKGDLDPIAELSHQIKGCGTAFGFPHLTRLAAKLERAVWEEDEGSVQRWVRELARYVRQLAEADLASLLGD